MTLNAKALKDSPKRPFSSECGCPEECGTEHGRIKKILYSIGQFFMFKVYYPLESFYTRTKERIFRSYDYARFGWLNYDFDMSCAWDLLEFKLKRLRKCLQNGHAIQEPADMAALDEFVKIVRRLGRGNYDRKYYRAHDRKWGKIESRTEPWVENGKRKGSHYFSWRTKCPENAPKKLKDQERKDNRKVWADAEKDRVKDIERMGEILVKSGLRWWD